MAYAFRRRPNGDISCRLEGEEKSVIAQVAQEVFDLIRIDLGMDDDTPSVMEAMDSDDPLRRLEAEFAATSSRTPRDSASKRLFPDASTDPASAEEFRRFGQTAIAETKLADLRTLMRTLDQSGLAFSEVTLHGEEVTAWLRSLTTLRIVLADRLGVEREGDFETLAMLQEIENRVPEAEDAPTTEETAAPELMMAVYELLSWLQESLLRTLQS